MGRSFNRAITGRDRGLSSAIKVIPLGSKSLVYEIKSLQGSMCRVSSSCDVLFDGSKINSCVCGRRRRSWLDTVYVYPLTVSPRFSLII